MIFTPCSLTSRRAFVLSSKTLSEGELVPFVGGQLSVFDLLAGDFADVHDETVDQLHVAHFQREHGYGDFVVHGHLGHHGDDEGGLTHSRSGCDDDQVGILPSAGHLVQLAESGGQTRESVLSGGSDVEQVERLFDDGVDLGVLRPHVLLRELEEATLCALHQVGHVDARIEGLGLQHARQRDDLSGEVFLLDHLGVVFDVGRGVDGERQTGHIGLSAHFGQITFGVELLHHGDHVDGLLPGGQVAHGFVDLLVALVVEALGAEDFGHLEIGVLLHHQRAEHHSLHLEVLGLAVSEVVHTGHFHHSRLRFSATFCHQFDNFPRKSTKKNISYATCAPRFFVYFIFFSTFAAQTLTS